MHVVELISTGDGQIMETLDNIGIKLFVLAALKEYRIYSRNSRTFLTKILYLNLGCLIYARKRFYVNKSGYTSNFF